MAGIATSVGSGRWRALGIGLGLLLITVLLVSCGDEKRRPPPPPEAAAAAAGPDPVLEHWELLGENPRFVPLKSLFDAYQAAKIEELANPMLANAVEFVERPVIQNNDADLSAGSCGVPGRPACPKPEDDVVDRPTDPRARRPLADYSVIILMTGTSRPKAVVTDTTGGRFTLERGDPIGMEGGRVKAILQYKMLVAVPGKADAFVMSLEPPLTDMGDEPESGGGDS
jgi:hypothetical protein